jgi:hypothetical protein
MYLHRHDEEEALAVWLFSRATDAEWDEHCGHLRAIATWSKKTEKRAACVLIAMDFDRPDAKRRQELALLTKAPGYDPYVAFVWANAAVRAVLSVFQWVQKAPKYEMDFFPTTTEAVKWLGTKRGGRLFALEDMVRDVERDISTAARVRLAAHGG